MAFLAVASGPQFHAVVEYWHSTSQTESPIFEIDAHRVWHGAFARYGGQAELHPGPGSAFAIIDGERIDVYRGLTVVTSTAVPENAWVIGWDGPWPIVRTGTSDDKNLQAFVVTDRERIALPQSAASTSGLAGSPRIGLVCVPDFKNLAQTPQGLNRISWLRKGSFTPISGLANRNCSVAWLEDRAVLGTEEYQDRGEASLLTVQPTESRAKVLARHRGTAWEVRYPDRRGRCWITEDGWTGRMHKFHDFARIYKLTAKGGLQRVAIHKGEFLAWGSDRSDRWLLGWRVDGWEMGAYDLIAKNLRTGRDMVIDHAINEFKELE